MVDIGHRCVHCGEDTSFGSGRFVNRIPADADYGVTDKDGNVIFAEDEYLDGYACGECGGFLCDRCDEQIYIDCDVMADQVYPERDPRAREFKDGAVHVHEECLTPEEKRLYEKEQNLWATVAKNIS